jgi:hypothetical protein
VAYNVSSWFIDQLKLKSSSPKRRFTIGTSDYSARVLKWPTWTRTSRDVIASKATVDLANHDGTLNSFHERIWTMANTCSLSLGFTHPTSGDEWLTLFSGDIKEVKYPSRMKCQVNIRDRFWGLTEKKIGTSDIPVSITSQTPAAIAWTLVTCYGLLSSVASTSNPHIDYDSYLAWAAQFSADNVLCAVRYDETKVSEALVTIADYTDSAIWTDGDGKLRFIRYSEPTSMDFALTGEELTSLIIKVDGKALVNKAWCYGNYSPVSNYWAIAVYAADTTAINTFGLHEQIWKDEQLWYINSVSALTLATRKTLVMKYPPRRFEIKVPPVGLHRQLGEMVRFVDSFYHINSGTAWRFNEIEVDLQDLEVSYILDESIAGNGFYLDVDDLDGDKLLL